MSAPWNTPKMWNGSTAFILGGGASLKSFDWTLLHGRRVIGCNDSYLLGPKVVDVCLFGDFDWYRIEAHREGLKRYSGVIVSAAQHPINSKRIFRMVRRPRDLCLHLPGKLGWWTNTGATAINLALKFGCAKVVLLGFDMKLADDGDANWHRNLKNGPNATVYKKFLTWFGYLKDAMTEHCPDVEVVNATPGSALDLYPIMDPEEVLAA